jgi:hypothetical protein
MTDGENLSLSKPTDMTIHWKALAKALLIQPFSGEKYICIFLNFSQFF